MKMWVLDYFRCVVERIPAYAWRDVSVHVYVDVNGLYVAGNIVEDVHNPFKIEHEGFVVLNVQRFHR